MYGTAYLPNNSQCRIQCNDRELSSSSHIGFMFSLYFYHICNRFAHLRWIWSGETIQNALIKQQIVLFIAYLRTCIRHTGTFSSFFFRIKHHISSISLLLLISSWALAIDPLLVSCATLSAMLLPSRRKPLDGCFHLQGASELLERSKGSIARPQQGIDSSFASAFAFAIAFAFAVAYLRTALGIK